MRKDLSMAPVLAKLTTSGVARMLAEGPTDVIIPLGALEQHGPHLPISTDQVIAEALALRAATEVGACAVGPCVPIGVSNHHLGFAGTTTLSAPVMASIQVEIVTSLLANGFRNAYLVTGHAGNCASMAEAVRRLSERFGNHVVAFDDWPAQRSALHAVATDLGLDPERVGTHAGHFETSIMCLLVPDLVQLDRAEAGFIGPAREASRILLGQGMKKLSSNGVIGDPQGASAAAGRGYLDALVAHVVDGITEHRRPSPTESSSPLESAEAGP